MTPRLECAPFQCKARIGDPQNMLREKMQA
jgi:hypothetical protein